MFVDIHLGGEKMFWIVLLLGVGATVTVVDRMLTPAVIAVIVASVVLGYALMGIVWFNDQTGISDFIVGSWQTLSGVDTPGQIVSAKCDNPTWWVLPGFLLALANAIPGIVAIAGLPIGLGITIFGGLNTLITEDRDLLRTGLKVLLVAIGALVLAGLVMRTMHYMDQNLICPNG